MKLNDRNLDAIGSMTPNMGKKLRPAHLDDPDADIAYYALENRGSSGSQNKQKITTCQPGPPLEISQTSAVGPFLQI